MDLQKHYDNLYRDSINKINSGNYLTDNLIDSDKDNRYGLTLLFRPDDNVLAEIQKLINDIKLVEPWQYFYPESDIHVTVLSIISCYEGFNLNLVKIEDYIEIIKQSLSGTQSFNIDFKGLTASPSCLMNELPRRRAAGYLKTRTTACFCAKWYILFQPLDHVHTS